MPPRTHGVYLFTEGGKHMYVGRTGVTERAAKAGKPSSSGFRHRLAGHSRPSSSINTASFAVRLAMTEAERKKIALPTVRGERLQHPRFVDLFLSAKERITAMEFRTVDIPDDRESYVFELYAAFVLDTPFNSFATS